MSGGAPHRPQLQAAEPRLRTDGHCCRDTQSVNELCVTYGNIELRVIIMQRRYYQLMPADYRCMASKQTIAQYGRRCTCSCLAPIMQLALRADRLGEASHTHTHIACGRQWTKSRLTSRAAQLAASFCHGGRVQAAAALWTPCTTEGFLGSLGSMRTLVCECSRCCHIAAFRSGVESKQSTSASTQ